jgi:LysM repeat protein
MKVALWISAAFALPFILNSCSNSVDPKTGGQQQPGIGPFDSQGRYHEEWADNPAQWRKPGGSSTSRVTKNDDLPQIAQNEQPLPNSVPLAPTTKLSPPKPTIAETKAAAKPSIAAKKESEAVVVKTRPLNQSERDAVAARTKSKAEPEVVKVKPKSKPEPEVVKTKLKPKPEPEVAKTKSKSKETAKAKPKTSRYVVKSGDSLSAIASRNGCSVSALQRENGISGTMIHPGQSLSIPRK